MAANAVKVGRPLDCGQGFPVVVSVQNGVSLVLETELFRDLSENSVNTLAASAMLSTGTQPSAPIR